MVIEALVSGAIGLFVGSFLNVVVLRIKAGKQFVKGRSSCPLCKHELGPSELVPMFSWLMQRGRCKHCAEAISRQYPVVEFITGVLFALSYVAITPQGPIEWVQFVLWLYILSSAVVLAVYDLRWMILPDKVLLPIIIPTLFLAGIAVVWTGSWQPLWGALTAATLFGGGFYALAAVSGGRWMGGGDIKLAFTMGLLLGVQKTLLAMLLSFWAAGLLGIILIAAKRKSRRDLIPFGPFLLGGMIIAYLYGTDIIDWYMSVSGLVYLTS